MSEIIKHECGIALIRLLKPLEYYQAKYGSSFYGLKKLHLLMQKQHNRGQDGAGVACIKLDIKPGNKYINRVRSNSESPIKDIFSIINKRISDPEANNPKLIHDTQWLKENIEFSGELFLGHLRYGTFGKNEKSNLHPVIRSNNWKTRNLVLAGNFNMTNVKELFNKLVEIGQYPVETSDTITILEKIGHFIDEENEALYQTLKKEGYTKAESTEEIANKLDVLNILKNSAHNWDGGFAIAGMIGHGDAFVMRDPSGIRPAFYYANDEVVVATSERPAIQTAFNLHLDEVKELKPGNALIIKKNGEWAEHEYKKPEVHRACSFERIYFSRGTDRDIYLERKRLGKALCPAILKAIDFDFENTVFSYIPNTASVAFRGLAEELEHICDNVKKDKIIELGNKVSKAKLDDIFSLHPRIEKIAVKDVKLRTFITQDAQRDDLVGHVYDVTYGILKSGSDNLVVLDDSIVRGTTLKRSIIRILDRLGPKKIVIASSAPQIRYPDCYGIDMAKLNDFIAFRATIELLKETNQQEVINRVYKHCKEQAVLPKEKIVNSVKEIYKPFTSQQISQKISEMLKEKDIQADVSIIYQTIEDLHEAIPGHTGDWYFTGNYPTPGGNRVVNQSFINFIEGKNIRAY
ncbi:MAG: amidophosphoribosyltransferase [Bacteroidales bacterium]|nr:amidophosphoribosyltransferase [Bacteroidales bacterium]MCF8405419.1 amidophosphoribosyltransferase [Bacteroidales bacterium]